MRDEKKRRTKKKKEKGIILLSPQPMRLDTYTQVHTETHRKMLKKINMRHAQNMLLFICFIILFI